MKKISWITILNLLILFLLNFNLSFAQSESIIFGPKQYEKPKGRPVTYTDSFQANTGTKYKLWVQSGENRHHEIKNVSIRINGVEVLNTKNLKKHHPFIKTIRLKATNIIKVVLKGKERNFITVKIFGPHSNINVNVTSPLSGETISRPDVMVKGTITNTSGNETGVTVNGIVANIYGNQFIANHIPLVEGLNTINVIAKDTSGNKSTNSVTVTAVKNNKYIKITSNIESGIAPLEIKLTIASSFSLSNSYLTYTGPAQVEFLSTTTSEYKLKITTEGIYYFTINVNDQNNKIYQDTIGITVLNKTDIDTLLQSKYEGMKQALANKDVEKTLNYLTEDIRDKFREIFNALSDDLPNIVSGLQNIKLISVKDGVAKYYIKKLENGKDYAYFIYFMRDENGIWKIENF